MKALLLDNKFQNLRQKLIILLGGAIASALSGYLVSSVNTLDWSLTQSVLLSLLFILCVLPFVRAIRPGRFDLFEPINMFAWVFFVAFVVSSIIMISIDYIDRTGVSYRIELSDALAVVIVGLVGSYVGYIWARAWLAKLLLPKFEAWVSRVREVQEVYIFRYAIIALLLTAAGFGLWLQLAGLSIGQLNAVFDEDITYGTAHRAAVTNILYFWTLRRSWPLLILLAWLFAPNRFWRLVMSLAWLANLAAYAMTGNRSTIFILIGATVVVYYVKRQSRPSMNIILLGLAVVITLSGLVNLARGRLRSEIEGQRIVQDFVDEITHRGAASGLMNITYVFPEQAEFLGFDVIGNVIYAPIPRVLWPGKPSSAALGRTVNRYLERTHAPGVMGVYYAGFSILGPFIILFIYGTISGLIYEFFRRNSDFSLAWVILAGWLPFIWVMIHRGGLVKFLVATSYTFGPILLVWFIAYLSSHHQNRQHKNIAPFGDIY